MGSKTVNELTLKLNADMAELRKDLKKASGQLNKFQKGVKSIGSTIKGAFVVGAIAAVGRELIQFAGDAMRMGGELAGVKAAFDELNNPALLNELKAATKGTVSELELMKQAVKANEFNIPIDQMATMMQFATMQAQKMGESVDYMAESITTGLARGSLPILDNLGLSAKELKQEMKKTGDISSAAINIMNKKIAESGGIIETSATITARWGARWDNMKAKIGTLLNDALVKISPVLEDIRTWFIELWDSATRFIVDTYNGWVDLYNESAAFRLMIESIKGTFGAVWSVIKAFFKGIWDSLKTVGKLLAYTFNPRNWGKDFGKGLNEIMLKNVQNTVKLTKELGNDIGENLKDGVKNIMQGSADYLTVGDLAFKGGSAGAIKEAKDLGEKIKQALIKPIKFKAEISDEETEFFPTDEIQEQEEEFWQVVAPMRERAINFTEEFQGMLSDSIGAIASGIGEAMASGKGALEKMFTGVLNIVLDFGANLGKQMIALGTSAIVLKKLMLNPATAIAAGAALIAVTSAIRSLVNKGGPKFAGGGIVPGNSTVGDRVPILANGGEMVLNQGQQSSLFRMLNSGSSGSGKNSTLTARVSGNDLLFLLEQTKIRKGLVS